MNQTALTPEAELHYTRGMLHLRRGEAAMPYALAANEEKTPPGADMILALLGLATVATSKAFGATRWIETYKGEMRSALHHFDEAVRLAPTYPDSHYRRAHVLRYLSDAPAALESTRNAVALEPDNREYTALLRILEGGQGRRSVSETRNSSSVPSMEPIGLTWDDIILPAKTKRELRQMQLVLENPRQAQSLGVEPPTGLLLYGPPGTGKTTVARILAAQAKCKFIATAPAEINNMWVGESEKAVAKLFDEARRQAPAIIFLDEVDALIPLRSGGMHQYSDKVVNQFLHEMDGLTPNEGLFIVGATNRPDMLDPALVRGGRLSRHIEIPLPDQPARLALLKMMVRRAQMDGAIDIEQLSVETVGFSGADLRALVNEAGLQALIRIADTDGVRTLTTEDFEVALANLRRD